MQRLLRFTLLAVIAFSGITLAGVGVDFWLSAQPTAVTFFDTLKPTSDEDGLRCGTPDPFFDWDFILHHTVAVIVLAFGLALFCWAVALMKRKSEYRIAT